MIYIQHTPDGIRAEREPFDGGVAYGEVGEPIAWMTHHDDPMLFIRKKEAELYCDDDEQPIPLYTGASSNNELRRFRALLTRVKGDDHG